jgi:hypothetical protein
MPTARKDFVRSSASESGLAEQARKLTIDGYRANPVQPARSPECARRVGVRTYRSDPRSTPSSCLWFPLLPGLPRVSKRAGGPFSVGAQARRRRSCRELR